MKSGFQIMSVDATLAAAPFETLTKYTDVAMAVKVPGFIADMVCPRIPAPYKFAYTKLDTGDRLSAPNSRASRAGRVNEIEFGSTDEQDVTEDYALACPVPSRDIEEARAQGLPYDPLAEATDALATVMKINREIRVAGLVFDDSNYETGYKATLQGASQWSNASSDPLTAILQQMDTPLVRPNTLVCGQKVWTKLRSHPKIVEAINMSGAGDKASGAVAKAAVAELFELDQVLVGSGQYQTANRGQDEAYKYIWGNHAALLHINGAISGMRSMMPSFCFTAEAMMMQVGTYVDSARGTGQGTTFVKSSESCKEVVSWPRAGYFFKNAAA